MNDEGTLQVEVNFKSSGRAILPSQVGLTGRSPASIHGMRRLVTLSLVLLVAGLALGLLNFYIDGRIGAPMLFGMIVSVSAIIAFVVTLFTRNK